MKKLNWPGGSGPVWWSGPSPPERVTVVFSFPCPSRTVRRSSTVWHTERRKWGSNICISHRLTVFNPPGFIYLKPLKWSRTHLQWFSFWLEKKTTQEQIIFSWIFDYFILYMNVFLFMLVLWFISDINMIPQDVTYHIKPSEICQIHDILIYFFLNLDHPDIKSSFQFGWFCYLFTKITLIFGLHHDHF